ncbi:MAG: hypothetical protein M3Y67_07190, partial [Pseudomonadota bacterium]|nr:hypothetical protein [Pseudomonadota bacterium]
AFESSTSNLTQDTASLALYYSPGGSLRLGIAARTTRTDTPQAFPIGTTGAFESNQTTGKNIDLLADYRLSGIVNASGRLSHTQQTNSNPQLVGADFSGLTGSLNVNYQATGKVAVSVFAARDAGFNSSLYNALSVTQIGLVKVVSPVTGLYQTNQVTNSAGINFGYAATAKITANAGVRYARARLLSNLVGSQGSQAQPDTTDVLKSLYLGANYAIARNWGLSCNVGHESRSVSGGISYAYANDTIGCFAQYTWR